MPLPASFAGCAFSAFAGSHRCRVLCKTCGRLSSSAASFNDHTQIILVLIAAADEICNRGTMGGGFGAIPEILSLTIKSDSRFIQHIYILYLWMELRQILVI